MDNRYKDLAAYLKNDFIGRYRMDEPIALHTWYRIGGPADFFCYPGNTESLTALLNLCKILNIDTYLIGDGANILASDEGFRGVMINLSLCCKQISVENETLMVVGAGVLLPDLVLACEKNSLGGMEYLSGIPGTTGGALIMNAGTIHGVIGDRVQEVYLLNENLEPVTVHHSRISFKYRSVPQLENKIVLGCKLKLYNESEHALKQRRTDLIKAREASQPLEYPSCGCVFKHPPVNYVGAMVEELGLKGLRHGNAMISPKHGGFIVNIGNAKSADVMYLIEKVKEKVYNKFNVRLEPEVKFVGF